MADPTNITPPKKPNKDVIVTMDNAAEVEAEYQKEIIDALKETLDDRMHCVLQMMFENTAQNVMLGAKKKLTRADILDALNNTVSGGDTTYDETLDEDCSCDDDDSKDDDSKDDDDDDDDDKSGSNDKSDSDRKKNTGTSKNDGASVDSNGEDIKETTIDFDGDNDADDNVPNDDPTGKGKVKQRSQALDAEEHASGPLYNGINDAAVMEDKAVSATRKVVVKVNAKGKRRRKIICGKGKKLSGSTCQSITGQEKLERRIAIKKRGKTLKREGSSAKRKANRLRVKALTKRKSMGLKV